MNTLTINRMNDFYFKYLLGSEQRKHLTIQFLNAVLYDNEETQITDVCFLDKDQDPNFEHEKLSKLDILAQTNTGMQIDIEVQVLKHAYLSERFLYYWAGLYGSQLKEKDQYTQLKPTVSIILLDFDYLPETAWHNRYHICNDISKHTLTDHFAMHFIEIKKFTHSDVKKLTKLGTWAAYFSNCDEKELEVLAMNNTIMKDVAKAEHAFTRDETMRYQYMLREKAIRDYYSGLNDAKQEGIAIGEKHGEARGRKLGLAQGVQQEKLANIIGMLREGIDIQIIAKITSYSVEEIQRISKEHLQL